MLYIRNLKKALNHGVVLTKVNRVIKFNQNVWLKSYIDMNTDLSKKGKNDFEKDFFKLMNNIILGKTMENVRKHRDIKLVTTEGRMNYLVSGPNYHTTNYHIIIIIIKVFHKKIISNRIGKKKEIFMNKPMYLGLSILELSEVIMYEFRYDYVKLKYSEEAKLCSMDTDGFTVYIKTDDIYKDIAEDVETRFDTSNYELDSP